MLSQQLLFEIIWMFVLAFYTLFIIYLTRRLYEWMVNRRIKKSVAIYYNRKFIHIFAGGVVVLAVPFVFSSPWLPLLSGIIMAIITFIAHRSGNSFYWFQTEDNVSDVSFSLMWGIAIFVLWLMFDDPWIAIIPPAFIAFGDGITGIIRNIAFKERRKHPIGNIYMAGVCIPIGYYFASTGNPSIPLWGVFAAIIASLFERYEFGKIDDNILVAGSAIIILLIGATLGPIG
jgi:hypothetical protein